MDDLKALATLARVVETGSFRRAAMDMGVVPQATSKTVRRLEERLGVRLLHRTTRKLSLTEEGARLVGRIAPALADIRGAVQDLQACAAVGQMGLVQVYESAFSSYGLHTAQILLTHEDLADRKRYLNARSTLTTLLGLGVVPIINENDTVITDEIKFGDNDTLGALVANLIDADCLIILTDQSGLFTADPRKDPRATLISEARAGDPDLEAMAGGAGTQYGKGGMITKVIAAKRAANSGTHTVIASGREQDVMPRLARGESIGTLLVSEMQPLNARKQWLADHLQLNGKLVLDAGAVKALGEGKSLLPIGVVEVQGEFERGAVVACLSPEGQEVARGLINYGSSDARRIARHGSLEIEKTLGYIDEPEMIHRDNLVIC